MIDEAGSRHERGDGARTTLRRALATGGRAGFTASATARLTVGLASALALAATGCGEPVAEVVAVWVDASADDEGNRRVRIYEAGERDVVSIVPDIPGSGIDLLQIGIDGRARGIAVSATDATVWFERGSGRRVTLSAAAVGREEIVAPGFSFTRSGDAILRALEVDPALPPAWALASLSGPVGLGVHVVSPPAPAALGRRWSLVHAADAPVLVLAEVGGSPSSVHGRVLALAYPSDEGQGPVVDDVRPLARGFVQGRGPYLDDLRYLTGCPDGLCLAPSGRALWTLSLDRCDLWRWSWVDAASTVAETPPTYLPMACPGGQGDTRLVAVLDDDLLVLDDALRIYLVDVSSAVAKAGDGAEPIEPTVTALPKPGGLLSTYVVAHGHGLVVSSQQGEVARIDADGPRMVSGVQSTCVLRDGFAVSPGGAWVVQSCNGQSGGPEGFDGQIQRISVLGSELFGGVPMRPIAIDDEGNALLYSIDSDDDDGVPRGLFVLTGDGQLTRVDELEPFPGRVLLATPDGGAGQGRFAAGGPS